LSAAALAKAEGVVADLSPVQNGQPRDMPEMLVAGRDRQSMLQSAGCNPDIVFRYQRSRASELILHDAIPLGRRSIDWQQDR
jgi:hypothetical protein